MEQNPANLKYTKTHEWIRKESDGSLTVGITHHAQEHLGDVVYVELPDLEKTVETNAETAVVESVKAASDIYSPVAGKVIAVNEALHDKPELINQSPYENGWIFKLAPNDINELDNLLSAESYQQLISE